MRIKFILRFIKIHIKILQKINKQKTKMFILNLLKIHNLIKINKQEVVDELYKK